MAIFGNPQDVLSTPYGYSGQMSPEAAVQAQALNRRRLLANLLTQQGMAPTQGHMAGRFYVPASPLQGVAGLAQVLAGTLGNKYIDDQQADVVKKDASDAQAFIQDWQTKQKLLQAMGQAPAGAAEPSPPTAPAAPEAAVPPPPSQLEGAAPGPPVSLEATQNIGPRPQNRPDPHTGVSNFRAPGNVLHSGAQMAGISQDVTPGDMSTMVHSADPEKAKAQLGDQAQLGMPLTSAPVAPPTPMPTPPGPPRKTTMDDLAALLTHQHPQVRAYGAMLANNLQRDQERDDQRAFTANENALNRDVRREGILENSRMREAQLQNTMALTQMQIDSRMQQGRDANELKSSLAQQANELQKLQLQTATELKKAEIGSRATTAKQHDETLKAIAQMNADGKKDAAAAKLDTKQNEQAKAISDTQGTIAILRDSYDQLDKGGGITNTDKSGLANVEAAVSSSAPGQMVGKMFGTKNQSARNTIDQSRPLLMANIMRAMGITAKQLDSNAELKLWLNAATDPTLDLQANRSALDHLESMIGSGASTHNAPIPSLPAGAKQIGTSGGKPVYQTPDGKKFIGE